MRISYLLLKGRSVSSRGTLNSGDASSLRALSFDSLPQAVVPLASRVPLAGGGGRGAPDCRMTAA
jgi:hypothetical protein